MAKAPIIIEVKESAADLERMLRNASPAIRPRIRMLLLIANGTPSSDTQTVAHKSKVSDQAIRTWKKIYLKGGAAQLLKEGRGGSIGVIDQAGHQKIAARLSEPKQCFTSFEQARRWINENLGLQMEYHAVNKYLVRNFGVRMKVGRKSHVKKDEAATADYKKPVPEPRTY